MTPDTLEAIKESYDRLKNLKLVEQETGVKWQTVYWHLKREGVEVCGDKARYGSASDRVGLLGEQRFKRCVPFAEDNNHGKWQATVDFSIGSTTIDVKTARLTPAGRQPGGKSFAARWSFCVSKQQDVADFFVLYALPEQGDEPEHAFLLPREIATAKATISIPTSLKSKWADYEISEGDLADFFMLVDKDERRKA